MVARDQVTALGLMITHSGHLSFSRKASSDPGDAGDMADAVDRVLGACHPHSNPTSCKGRWRSAGLAARQETGPPALVGCCATQRRATSGSVRPSAAVPRVLSRSGL